MHNSDMSFDVYEAADILLDIEIEMRQSYLWEVVPPEPDLLASPTPFCFDTLSCTQWLQWVFIPHTRTLAERGGRMPEASGIRPMGEEALRGCDWETIPLLVLLDRFDRAINR